MSAYSSQICALPLLCTCCWSLSKSWASSSNQYDVPPIYCACLSTWLQASFERSMFLVRTNEIVKACLCAPRTYKTSLSFWFCLNSWLYTSAPLKRIVNCSYFKTFVRQKRWFWGCFQVDYGFIFRQVRNTRVRVSLRLWWFEQKINAWDKEGTSN